MGFRTALFAALFVAGCLSSPPLTGIATTRVPASLWSPGALWVTATGGCGFCGGEPGGSPFTIVALYDDGAVLRVDAGANDTPNAPRGAELPADTPTLLAAAIQELHGRIHSFWTGTDARLGMKVFHATTGRLQNWTTLGPQFQALLDARRASHQASTFVTDCGPSDLESFQHPIATGEVGCNRAGGNGWPQMSDAFGAVGVQLAPLPP
ncbi:MAG: hypothetical protein ACYDBQ_08815 [Thermoplasmatota archaeon]